MEYSYHTTHAPKARGPSQKREEKDYGPEVGDNIKEAGFWTQQGSCADELTASHCITIDTKSVQAQAPEKSPRGSGDVGVKSTTN